MVLVDGHQKAKLKKCPTCKSVSLDTENSCGVCGESLSGVTTERLEQLVHKETGLKPKKKLNLGPLALVIFALATTAAGALLLFFNGIGIIPLLVGLLAILLIVGGGGASLTRVRWRRARAMTRGEEEVRRDAEERKRRTGQED